MIRRAQLGIASFAFDQATKLYTYTYQVDFRGFPETGTLIFGECRKDGSS